jgi:hypothetical protein
MLQVMGKYGVQLFRLFSYRILVHEFFLVMEGQYVLAAVVLGMHSKSWHSIPVVA